jgi:hypothetical protein
MSLGESVYLRDDRGAWIDLIADCRLPIDVMVRSVEVNFQSAMAIGNRQ